MARSTEAARYRAQTSFSLGLADGTPVPVNTGDLLPDEWSKVTIETGDCAYCADFAGDAVIGQDPLPPFHPNCTCVAVPA
jgi:hypothetical protein